MSANCASTKPPVELAPGIWQFQTPLWQTNSLLVCHRDTTVVVDPAWTPEEIQAIVRLSEDLGGEPAILLTHADYDHICGVGAFHPDVEVIAGAATAARIADGSVRAALADAGREWGLLWSGTPRVDRIVATNDEFSCAQLAVRAIDAPGHVSDGLAYVFAQLGLLVPGDYLSSITFPFINGSLKAAIETHRRLLAELEAGVEIVVPGHGPVHDVQAARTIAAADLHYLLELESVVRQTREEALSPGAALLATYEVRPPRANTNDFEVYGIRAHNCRVALAEFDVNAS